MQTKHFLHASLDSLARRFLDWAERGDRAIGVLNYRSPTATMFYTAKTLQDELLTIKHCCVRRSPQYAALVQCSQASSDEAYDNTDSKKGPPYNKRFKLRTPPFQSFYIPTASFHKRIPNPSQHKATEAYGILSFPPNRL